MTMTCTCSPVPMGPGMHYEDCPLAATEGSAEAVARSRAAPGSGLREAVEALAKEWDEKRAKAETAADKYSVEATGAIYGDRANIWEDCADALRATLAAHPEAPPESDPAPSTVECSDKLGAKLPSPPAETAPPGVAEVSEVYRVPLGAPTTADSTPDPTAPDLKGLAAVLQAGAKAEGLDHLLAAPAAPEVDLLADMEQLCEWVIEDQHADRPRVSTASRARQIRERIRALTPAVPGAADEEG